MDALIRDLRGACRRLARSPGFAATAIATLALCLGANLAIFAVVDAVLVRALPYPQPDRLVTLFNAYPGAGVDRSGASMANYFDRRHALRAFRSLALYNDGTTIVGGAGSPETVPIARVTPEFFSTLGVPLARGRAFTDAELAYGTDQVAILTDEYWRSHFGADPHVLGRTFLNDGLTQTIIGVLPPHFRYLSSRAQFFRPASSDSKDRLPAARHSNNYAMIARLAPGVSLAQAQAEMDAFNFAQLKTDPYRDIVQGAGYHTTVALLHADFVRTARPMLLLLQAGVGVLLLIGCVNLVNLLLIRASARSKELAVRQALGASRGVLARGALAETALLALAGAAGGLAVGGAGIALLRVLAVDRLPLGATIGFDYRLILAALAAAAVVAAGLALPVVVLTGRGDLASVLQTESRSGTTSRATQRVRLAFIVLQIALAFVLLSGAGLLGLSLQRVLAARPGFDPSGVLTASLSLPWKNYRDDRSRIAFVQRLLPALAALPGVQHAAIVYGLPFGGGFNDSAVTVDHQSATAADKVRAHYVASVGGEYFQALRIPLVRGRLPGEADLAAKNKVCVVDQAFAERYWPGGDPLGHRLIQDVTWADKDASTIVGVVGNVKQNELANGTDHGEVYFPYGTQAPNFFYVAVRCGLPPAAVAPMLRRAVAQLDPELPLNDIRPLQARIDDSLTARRSPALMAYIFAGTALLLAAIGTYGLLSYAVAQREREIGIRMALGALPAQIRGQFLGIGLRALLAGAALGTLAAWAAGRAMQGMLFDVPPLPLGILLLTVAVMTATTIAAALIPAGRAMRTNPMTALRSD